MRIIDADRLKRKVQRVATDAWKMKLTASIETTLNQFIDYLEEAPTIKTKEVKYFDEDENVWKIGEVIVNSSEKPNKSEIPTGSERRAPITALELALSECKARHNGCENCTTECAWKE